MTKQFKKGFCVLRMQHLHLGHQLLIDHGIKSCEEFLVLIGSSQEVWTKRNPYSKHLREFLLKQVYGDKIKIAFLPDYTDETDDSYDWGDYLLQHVTDAFGEEEYVQGEYVSFVGSKDLEKHESWYTDNNRPEHFVVSNNEVNIDATTLRECLVEGNIESWKQFVDPRLHLYYEGLRTIAIAVEDGVRFETTIL